MNTAVDVLLLITTLFVGVWVLLFGTAGAMLNRRRGRSPIGGLMIGVFFGPFGLAYLAWSSRASEATVTPPAPPPLPGSHTVAPSPQILPSPHRPPPPPPPNSSP